MTGTETKNCQQCGGEITAEQIARREAGLVKGVLLCPGCVDRKRQELLRAQQAAAAASQQGAAAGRAADDGDSPLSLVSEADMSGDRMNLIKSLGTGGLGTGVHHDERLQRPMTGPDGHPTRCRTFHAKLTDASIAYLNEQINEWVDSNPDVYIKQASTDVGIVEGKHSEPHLIVTIFY